jgi:hypothetical protein
MNVQSSTLTNAPQGRSPTESARQERSIRPRGPGARPERHSPGGATAEAAAASACLAAFFAACLAAFFAACLAAFFAACLAAFFAARLAALTFLAWVACFGTRSALRLVVFALSKACSPASATAPTPTVVLVRPSRLRNASSGWLKATVCRPTISALAAALGTSLPSDSVAPPTPSGITTRDAVTTPATSHRDTRLAGCPEMIILKRCSSDPPPSIPVATAGGCGPGNDRLGGGDAGDWIRGGPGNDTISGGAGRDLILAGRGDDTVLAADGECDWIRCGPGQDEYTADRQDRVGDSCETDITP